MNISLLSLIFLVVVFIAFIRGFATGLQQTFIRIIALILTIATTIICSSHTCAMLGFFEFFSTISFVYLKWISVIVTTVVAFFIFNSFFKKICSKKLSKKPRIILRFGGGLLSSISVFITIAIVVAYFSSTTNNYLLNFLITESGVDSTFPYWQKSQDAALNFRDFLLYQFSDFHIFELQHKIESLLNQWVSTILLAFEKLKLYYNSGVHKRYFYILTI